MRKIKLTEKDLTRLIRRVVSEQDRGGGNKATEHLTALSDRMGVTVPPNTDPQQLKWLCCIFGMGCCDFRWPWDRDRY